ncbi:UNVERIFIED_CONTAM: hypothetical protein RMT77_001166 [Armadillidium vulgare]
MSNYEKQIFEQVIDNYLGESQENFLSNESSVNSLNFKINSPSPALSTSMTKDENISKKCHDNQKKKRESKSKAVLIEAEYHENLPKGWKKVVVQRTTGATAGKYDVYFFTPSGRKLRSKNEIKDYSEKHKLDLDLTTFGFSRPKRDNSKTPNKKLKSCKQLQSPIEKEADSCDTSCSVISTECLSKASTDNSDTVDNSCVEIDNIFTNIEEEIKSLTDVSDIPVVLDLPNTSFSKSNKFSELENKSVSSVEEEIDLDQNNLGKIFKIERPISFSCF